MADTQDLGSCASACGFKSHGPHSSGYVDKDSLFVYPDIKRGKTGTDAVPCLVVLRADCSRRSFGGESLLAEMSWL